MSIEQILSICRNNNIPDLTGYCTPTSYHYEVTINNITYKTKTYDI